VDVLHRWCCYSLPLFYSESRKNRALLQILNHLSLFWRCVSRATMGCERYETPRKNAKWSEICSIVSQESKKNSCKLIIVRSHSSPRWSCLLSSLPRHSLSSARQVGGPSSVSRLQTMCTLLCYFLWPATLHCLLILLRSWNEEGWDDHHLVVRWGWRSPRQTSVQQLASW
jgi:hypothetical protein